MVKRHGKYRKHKKITSSTIKEPQSVYVRRTQKKELLDFLRTISGTRVSHTQAYLESHLALPSKVILIPRSQALPSGSARWTCIRSTWQKEKEKLLEEDSQLALFQLLMLLTALKIMLFLSSKQPQTDLLNFLSELQTSSRLSC